MVEHVTRPDVVVVELRHTPSNGEILLSLGIVPIIDLHSSSLYKTILRLSTYISFGKQIMNTKNKSNWFLSVNINTQLIISKNQFVTVLSLATM